MTGLGMVAMGEFSFVIAKTAFDLGAVDQLFYSSVIGASLITMLYLPASFRRAPETVTALEAFCRPRSANRCAGWTISARI